MSQNPLVTSPEKAAVDRARVCIDELIASFTEVKNLGVIITSRDKPLSEEFLVLLKNVTFTKTVTL